MNIPPNQQPVLPPPTPGGESTRTSGHLEVAPTAGDDFIERVTDKLPGPPVAQFEALRVVNTIAFISNLLVSYGLGVAGGFIFAVPTNAQLSYKYQTLITPEGWTFSIWGLIFLAQGAWVVQQWIPQTAQGAKYTVNNMQYRYLYVCIFQILWSGFFSNEILFMSFLAMCGLWVSLWRMVIMNRNGNEDDDEEEYPEANEVKRSSNCTSVRYWFDEFPFTIHFGWICAALLVNFSVWLVGRNTSTDTQSFVADLSIFIILVGAGYLILVLDFVSIPLVFSWALFGIHFELTGGITEMIAVQFSKEEIIRVRTWSFVVAILLIISVAIKTVVAYTMKSENSAEHDDDSPGGEAVYVRAEDNNAPNTTSSMA